MGPEPGVERPVWGVEVGRHHQPAISADHQRVRQRTNESGFTWVDAVALLFEAIALVLAVALLWYAYRGVAAHDSVR